MKSAAAGSSRITRSLPALTGLLVILCAPAHADRFADARKSISIELPKGWKRIDDGFNFRGPNGEAITEIKLPSDVRQLRDVISALPEITAGFDEAPGNRVSGLSGEGWAGTLRVFRGKAGSENANSTLMALLIRGRKEMRMVRLIASDAAVEQRQDQYLVILKSIELQTRVFEDLYDTPHPVPTSGEVPAPG